MKIKFCRKHTFFELFSCTDDVAGLKFRMNLKNNNCNVYIDKYITIKFDEVARTPISGQKEKAASCDTAYLKAN
jgi:hypothetical protein